MGGKGNRGQQLTPLELQIMQVLWELGPASVQAVSEELPEPRLAYTTVQTMLNVLHRKGRVTRTLHGKAYHYQPVVTREKVMRQAVGDLVDRLFGGSVDGLLMSLVKSRQLDPKKLDALSRLVKERKRNNNNEEENDGKL
jgi:predicted transcriptional regulator